jgi:hypothetical protein
LGTEWVQNFLQGVRDRSEYFCGLGVIVGAACVDCVEPGFLYEGDVSFLVRVQDRMKSWVAPLSI